MRIKDKIHMDRSAFIENGPITIVAFGDSITQGAFAKDCVDYANYDAVYHNRLRKKLLAVRDAFPINVINSGVGGTNTTRSLARIESQVTCHHPDLIIVCFGLNELGKKLELFLDSLGIIFDKCQKCGAEVIYMTPNMMNTYVPDMLKKSKPHYDYAHVTAGWMNSGKMDEYMAAAKNLAEKMGVKVCDCYGAWKELSETQDTTALLSNGINHPNEEMHELFADMLFDVIFADSESEASRASKI